VQKGEGGFFSHKEAASKKARRRGEGPFIFLRTEKRKSSLPEEEG